MLSYHLDPGHDCGHSIFYSQSRKHVSRSSVNVTKPEDLVAGSSHFREEYKGRDSSALSQHFQIDLSDRPSTAQRTPKKVRQSRYQSSLPRRFNLDRIAPGQSSEADKHCGLSRGLGNHKPSIRGASRPEIPGIETHSTGSGLPASVNGPRQEISEIQQSDRHGRLLCSNFCRHHCLFIMRQDMAAIGPAGLSGTGTSTTQVPQLHNIGQLFRSHPDPPASSPGLSHTSPMRSIARQSIRFVQNVPSPSCTRATTPLLKRPFHSAIIHRQDSRPPNGNPQEHDRALDETKDEERRADVGLAKSESDRAKDAEHNGEGRTTAEARKLGGRKRMRRPQDVPKPPPVPAWFMKHNVKLVKDVNSTAEVGKHTIVRCVDKDTGHTLFTVSYPVLARRPKTSRRQTTSAESVVGTTSIESVEQPNAKTEEDARVGITNTTMEGLENDMQDSSASNPRFFDQKVPNGMGTIADLSDHTSEELSRAASDFGRERTRGSPDSETDDTISGTEKRSNVVFINTRYGINAKSAINSEFMSPGSYAILEAELAIHAGFSLMSKEHPPSSSYAATRVDLALICPDPTRHAYVDSLVESLAQSIDADLIRLDANDFEDLTSEYISHGDDAPGSFTNLAFDVFDGYAAAGTRSMRGTSPPPNEQEEMEEDEEDEEDEEEDRMAGHWAGRSRPIADIRKILYEKRHELSKALSNVRMDGSEGGSPFILLSGTPSESRSTSNSKSLNGSKHSGNEFFQWDDAKLGVLLDSLLDAPELKRRSGDMSFRPRLSLHVELEQKSGATASHEDSTGAWTDQERQYWREAVSNVLLGFAKDSNPECNMSVRVDDESSTEITPETNRPPGKRRTIVHIRDLKDVSRSKLGDALLRRLIRTVVKRRKSGEEVLIVGTTAEEPGLFGSAEPDDFPFRTITIPPTPSTAKFDMQRQPVGARLTVEEPGYHRILEINIRHAQSMLNRLRPGNPLDLFEPKDRSQLQVLGSQGLSQRVLSFDQVQRLVLMAIGLAQSYAASKDVTLAHVMMATFIIAKLDRIARQWKDERTMKITNEIMENVMGKDADRNAKAKDGKVVLSKVEQIRKSCNSHETRLLTGVVDAQHIKTGFNDVHVQPETIEALKTLTTLSLVRPEAFKYGVLANDRLPGLLLYGPPGTGKTLLAKAVAKESKATVMEVSGAQIYEKYVGEGEKMVRAVFSLAKKLSPCVVFIDEADAIFGSRSNAGSRNTHREIINQFLREWDGLNDAGCFIMVATNRPFDLDDAVLRRLPRRLLVDLPVAKDRESILNIHLKEEAVDPAVSLAALAEQTPLYSGSDLKNLCVSAALACVREENDLLAKHKDDQKFQLPEKRTLLPKHFETATAEISASISEDMSSLTAIRKFDEQYGDRKGRRKKSGYGFGASEVQADENSVRVRQDTSSAGPLPPSSPPPAPSAP
nr:atpase family aaa domain-containing protein 1 [Quercus suber]